MTIRVFVLLIASATAACSQKHGQRTEIFLPARALAELTGNKLAEISGIAASVANPGMLWAHNDSGNDAEVFLVDEKLNIRLTCRLKGLVNRDWEDIAVGPGPEPGKDYLYIGEIGDNAAIYPYKHIYRFEEPRLGAENEITIVTFDTITFRLSDGAKDSEALFVHPVTKTIYVISKREEPVHLYEIPYPQQPGDTLIARKVMPLPCTQVVAADFSRDGKEFIMKNYQQIYYWKVGDRPLTLALRDPALLPDYTREPQGESIAFTLDAAGFYTLSEQSQKEKTYLYFYGKRTKR